MAASIANLSHQTLIKAALKLAGVADTASNEGDVDMIIKFESGWNPNAINLTDSNALAGHPSQGLMQTIASTFEAWRLPTLPDSITDPLANMVAGIRYAVGRYGSLDQVPGVASVHGGGGYVGYDNGGYLKPGVTQVYNGTGKPEPVFTPEQWATLSSQRGSGGKIAENLHIYGDNPEAIIHEVARRQSMAGQI
jgi:SLT domain-containing protein